MDVKQFHDSVKRGDLSEIKNAIAVDSSLAAASNEAGQSSFILAKYYRQEETASYLLGLLPKLSIFEACVAGCANAVVRELEQNPSLLESKNSDGWTALHLAAFFGHPELVNLLIERGAQVDSRSTNAMKNTPLHAGVAGGRAHIVELLLKHGADANARQEGGWTALHGAAQSGNREMVEALIAHGADVKARAANNQSALDLALQKGNESIAALLETVGARLE